MSIRSERTALPAPAVQLNNRFSSPPLTMELDQFFEFSFWLAEELTELEIQFACNKQIRCTANTPAQTPATFDGNGLPDDLQVDFF